MKCENCEIKELEKRLEKCEDCKEIIRPKPHFHPKQFPDDSMNKNFFSDCMHDNCAGCKTGTCSGVHMMSCSCKKCSPADYLYR